jgi:hypothetical protein
MKTHPDRLDYQLSGGRRSFYVGPGRNGLQQGDVLLL